MTKRIAWVDNEAQFTESYRNEVRAAHHERSKEQIEFSLYCQAAEALEKIPQENLDLIIINPYGLNYGANHHNVEDAWDNNAVGFDLAIRLQQKAPVMLVSTDSLTENYSEQFLLNRGASETVDLKDILPTDFYKILKKYLE